MTTSNEKSHLNFMNGTSFDINNPLTRLRCVAASCFFGEPSYYVDGDKDKKSKSTLDAHSPRRNISNENYSYLRNILHGIDDPSWRSMTTKSVFEQAIDDSLDAYPEETLQFAVELRKIENIRKTSQVIIVRAANNPKFKNSGLIRQYANAVIQRMDEPSVQLGYQLATYGKPIPNGLKRAWSDVLKKGNAYTLAKYRQEGKDVKTVDVANLAYGKGLYGYKSAIGDLMRQDLKIGEDNNTWENIRSNGGSWEDAIPVMKHMAILKNIRNFIENKVNSALWINKFLETAEEGKQLPFRYYTAYRQIESIASPDILNAMQDAMFLSMKNVPELSGRNLILVDNSGSARGAQLSSFGKTRVCDVGNLMGIVTGFASDEGVIGVFGDRLKCHTVTKSNHIFDQLLTIDRIGERIGLGTENGIWIALNDAIQNKEHWDNIFVYSDMQAGHGGLYGIDPKKYKDYIFPNTPKMIDVPKMVTTYRNTVNSKVNVFLVQIAGYQDTLIPEYYERTYILGGWSSSILNFAHTMNSMIDS